MEKEIIIAISGFQSYEGQEPDCVELVTSGVFRQDEDGISITYEESELTGMEGTFTSIHYTPQGAHLERTGNLVSTMDFTPGVRNTFAYDTPYGSATVGLETLEYTPALSEAGGTLNIVYVVDFDHAMVGMNNMHIEIRLQNEQKEEQV
jgi:uncharacterized beta-barrel protein YwiB (DUF1934 family)